ncbi:DUF2164 family protein [Enterobacter sp. DC4]|uniref:DUF2164 family protein n=1 Tax=Enterobacter sp. DC4 TaxID=1395580 RepID=UPI0004B30740
MKTLLTSRCINQRGAGQFDAEFFADFVIDTLGVSIYNASIEEAIKTHMKYSEHIQEEMELKRIL